MKTKTIQFRTDEENKQEIEIMAKSHGLSVAGYLRMISKRDYAAYRAVNLVPAVGIAEDDEQHQKFVFLD